MRKTTLLRVGDDFFSFTRQTKKELENAMRRKMSDSEFTDNIARWMRDENLNNIFKRRMKRSGGIR